jgi:acyl carrier protein phosphodiesterase
MNYLAHFYLSHYDENLIVGNYIADDIKGKAYLKYPIKIQKGILLHREIDTFTDNHSIVLNSKNIIRSHQKKFTPVVIDVFYDYFLAKSWNKHSNDNLKDFTLFVYKILFKNISYLPLKSQVRLSFMAKNNWLLNYREVGGVNKALTGLSKRTKYNNNMFNAHKALVDNEENLKKDFEQFFPDLKTFVNTQIKKGN